MLYYIEDNDGEETISSSRVCLLASSRYSAQVCGSPEDAKFQILTETLDQTLGRRSWTYCKRMGNARTRELRAHLSSQSNSQVTTLTAEVTDLRTELGSYRSQMSQLVQALS